MSDPFDDIPNAPQVGPDGQPVGQWVRGAPQGRGRVDTLTQQATPVGADPFDDIPNAPAQVAPAQAAPRTLAQVVGVKTPAAPAPVPAQPSAQDPRIGTLAATAPQTTAAQQNGVGWPGQALAVGEDALTLPLGVFAGIGNAAGDFTAKRDPQSALDAYMEGLATRGGVAMQNAEDASIGPGVARGLIRGGAASASNPLTLPALALGAIPAGTGTGILAALRQAVTSPMGGGTALGAATAGQRQAEYQTGLGSDPAALKLSDFLPMAIGAGGAGLGKLAASAPEVRQLAANLVRRAGKPSTDPEVLEAGNDFLVGQQHLPDVLKGAWLPEGIAKNFRRAMGPIVREVGRQARAADETGAMINMDRAVKEAESSVRGKQESRSTVLSGPEVEKAMEWAKARALVPDAAMQAKLAAADVPYEGRTIPLIGKEDVYTAVKGDPIIEDGAQSFDANLQPKFERILKLIGQKDIISGYQKLPDYQQPIPDIELPVSKAWNVQRGLQKAAYKNEPSETTPMAGRVAASKGIDQAIREQFGEKALGLIHAKDAAAPYLAAEPYFTSIERRANNYHGTPWEVWRMAHIAAAKDLWGESKLLDALASATKEGRLPRYAPSVKGEKKAKR